MAFDQTTRNRLQRFVSDARAALTEEFTRQLQNEYGLDPVSASVTPIERLSNLDDARLETAKILRDTLDHYRQTSPSEDLRALLDRIVREHAFTVLNRLAALRMAEARGLLIESLANGYNSKGLQLYARLAGTGLGERGDAYRSYLFSLFDEFALDLRVLFDRFSPTGRLFPREPALLETLALMNDPEVAHLWAEDETIGWIYQYFNSKEERKKMRDESAAPRNSRELAVRNQFFTPRYVVEFLTDNTLGRIWYEMTRGETRLKEQCRYLVRRPAEIFLRPGEEAESGSDRTEDSNLSQEELLKQPVFIPHRPLKDPREIRVLDPACGSMHFGLYAFDLLESIYEEAWDLEAPSVAPFIERSSELKPLRESYADKQEFLRDIPRLIIEHNLHGIDIDPRAVQIAGLSIWLRAQRAWQQQGVKAAGRPRIRRSNIVCAEPMPGEEALLNEFIERHLSATPELRLVAQLMRRVFKAMKLAGEAGSLLKIEEEVVGAVAEAKEQRQAEIERRGKDILFDDLYKHEQQPFDFEVAEITDETFWTRAEEDIYKALREYAEQVENGGGYQRRLFADDAERGFAFIDVCRKRYDVVLMNPPFGASIDSCLSILESGYPNSKHDLAASFIWRALQRLCSGFVGSIFTRSLFMMPGSSQWREMLLRAKFAPYITADYGNGVLDAFVETTASVFPQYLQAPGIFLNLIDVKEKELAQTECIKNVESDKINEQVYVRDVGDFLKIPLSPLCYWITQELLSPFHEFSPFEPNTGAARTGLATLDNFRFLRCWWEVPASGTLLGGLEADWAPLAKGGDTWPFYGDIDQRVLWKKNGLELKTYVANEVGSVSRKIQATEFYGKPGITWIQRSQLGFCPRALPSNCIFDTKGPSAFPAQEKQLLPILGILSTSLFQEIIDLQVSAYSYHPGVVQRSPFPKIDDNSQSRLALLTLEAFNYALRLKADETCVHFTLPAFLYQQPITGLSAAQDALRVEESSIITKLCKCASEIEALVHQLYEMGNSLLLGARQKRTIERMMYVDRSSSSVHLNEFVSWAIGLFVGRWDIRFATGERPAPELPDPFAPLPVCPPGMLQNEQGLPAAPADVPSSYTLRISWPSILVDDKGHAEDIERRVREALQVIWQDRADAIEQEACEILGVKTLRDYFGKPAGFFADHLQRYSKSRRQAPIYWPLSTRSGEYTLWLYYCRLNDQTLYTCVNNFVEPKLRQVSETVNQLRGKGSGRTRDEEKEFERLQDFEQELQEFRDELLRLAKLPWRPNLNDGVQVTAAPLWKLFRLPKWQKTLKDTRQSLEKGEYDWAHLAMTIWPQRVVPKCAEDRSLAIAHSVEDLFWVEDYGRWRALQSPKQEIEEQKRRRRSEAGERAKQLLCELAGAADGQLSAADVGNRLASGGYDDRELALLLYPQRMAEKCWEEVVLAQRLGLKLPTKKTKAARETFIKEIVARGCAELAPMVESALDGRARSFAEVWREIESGEREDLALALALWPDRVVNRCAEDMALAERHGLRKFFWVQHPTKEWRRRLSIEEEISNEVEWRRCVAAGLV